MCVFLHINTNNSHFNLLQSDICSTTSRSKKTYLSQSYGQPKVIFLAFSVVMVTIEQPFLIETLCYLVSGEVPCPVAPSYLLLQIPPPFLYPMKCWFTPRLITDLFSIYTQSLGDLYWFQVYTQLSHFVSNHFP